MSPKLVFLTLRKVSNMKMGMTVMMRGIDTTKATKKMTNFLPIKSILANPKDARELNPMIRITDTDVTTTLFLKKKKKNLPNRVTTRL